MINRVVLTGRLTKDLELRYSPNGVAMLMFTLAVNRQYKQEGQPESDFILCKAFKKNAENMTNHLSKGSLIGIEGRIQTGSYEKDGQRVYTTDVMVDSVTFLESKATNQQNNVAQQQNLQQAASQATGYQQPQQNYGQQQQYTQQPQYNQQQFNQQPQKGYQQNYTHMDDDPFASSEGHTEVSEDDLPF